MRIALLTNSYPPHARGGAGQIAFTQAKWLKSHGHEIRIFVPEPFLMSTSDPSITTFKQQTSVAFADLSKYNFLSRLIFHFEDLSPNIALIESVRAFHPEVIITHNLTGCGWGTPKILSQSGIRWIHILHDVQMIEPSGQILFAESFSFFRRLWRSFWAKQRSKSLGSPHVVISPSKWLLDFHKTHDLFSNSQTAIIPNPLLSANQIPIQDTNHSIQTAIQTKSVLFVGRVSKDKGLEVLIRAWQILQNKFSSSNSEVNNFNSKSTSLNQAKSEIQNFKCELIIIGSGSYLQFIKKLNDKTIKCLGALDHEKLADYYSKASLFVFPSLLMENQPTVLLEAMSSGINIVASDVGGVGELLKGYGALVPPKNPEALANAILDQLQKKPDLILANSILSLHSPDLVMEKMSSFFK